MRRVFYPLVSFILLLAALAGCAPAPPVVVEPPDELAASPTPERALLPTPTQELTATAVPATATLAPTFTPLPTATATPLPTMELPTLALNPPALAVWDGLPTYLADSAPGYYFRVRYDPERWALVTDQLGQAALTHRSLPSCIITPTAGRGLPPSVTIEHETIQFGELSIDAGKAYEAGVLSFVSYQVSDGTIFTGFEVNFQGESEACSSDALAVIETLQPVPASRATQQP